MEELRLGQEALAAEEQVLRLERGLLVRRILEVVVVVHPILELHKIHQRAVQESSISVEECLVLL